MQVCMYAVHTQINVCQRVELNVHQGVELLSSRSCYDVNSCRSQKRGHLQRRW